MDKQKKSRKLDNSSRDENYHPEKETGEFYYLYKDIKKLSDKFDDFVADVKDEFKRVTYKINRAEGNIKIAFEQIQTIGELIAMGKKSKPGKTQFPPEVMVAVRRKFLSYFIAKV